jgi:inorganic phosphate transporter, PiT family
MIATWLFISTGLFLGWSLGANHAVNVFGTAVVSRMVRFNVAALIAGVFVTLGAVFSGSGAARTLNELGAINALAGCFTVALAVGVTVTWMTGLHLPVSTSQAVVGGIIGWNLFTGSPTDMSSLTKIISTWVVCPALSAGFAFVLYKLVATVIRKRKLHVLRLDAYTRAGLIIVGAFASYSLGANNIGNVMGMFVSASPFADIKITESLTFSGTQQLFLAGGIAIAIGIFTYSYRVMLTVGDELFKITPVAGLVVVLAEALVLFLFASEGLQDLLIRYKLPSIPLVPLSSTQVVIGAVVGVGMAKGGRGINYRVLGRIATGWLTAPVAACSFCFVGLFIVQNVFEQKVVQLVPYKVSSSVVQALEKNGLPAEPLRAIQGKLYRGSANFRHALLDQHPWGEKDLFTVFSFAELDTTVIDSTMLGQRVDVTQLSPAQLLAVEGLHKRVFAYRWQLDSALAFANEEWRMRTGQNEERWNKSVKQRRHIVYEWFKKK